MVRLTLLRKSLERCTLGEMSVYGRVLYTIERPWIADHLYPAGYLGRSCVPLGRYQLIHHNGSIFKNVWALVNEDLHVYHQPADVPLHKRHFARTAILIHAGNTVANVIGCIAPGTYRTKLGGHHFVGRSKKAIRLLRDICRAPA